MQAARRSLLRRASDYVRNALKTGLVLEDQYGVNPFKYGFIVLLAARPPIAVAAVLVGAFAIFHGYAHSVELPKAGYPLAYGV